MNRRANTSNVVIRTNPSNTRDLPEYLDVGVFAKFLWLCSAISVGSYFLFSVIGAKYSLLVNVFFFASVLVGWYLLYKKVFKLAVLVVSLSLLISICGFIFYSGGFHSPFLIWLSVPPLILGLLVNWRWSVIAGTSILVFALFLKFSDHQDMHMSEFQVAHTMGMDHTIFFLSVTSSIITVIFFSFQNYKSLLTALEASQHKERTDTLTGILNRSGFNQFIVDLSGSKTDGPGGLIIFDVNDFKLINDNHGHMFGDYVLQTIASKVGQVIRAGDALARIGGDEFAVILPKSSSKQSAVIGHRIKHEIDTIPFKAADGHPISVSVSVGVATCDEAELSSIESMMHLADAALYEAKASFEKVIVKRQEQFAGITA